MSVLAMLLTDGSAKNAWHINVSSHRCWRRISGSYTYRRGGGNRARARSEDYRPGKQDILCMHVLSMMLIMCLLTTPPKLPIYKCCANCWQRNTIIALQRRSAAACRCCLMTWFLTEDWRALGAFASPNLLGLCQHLWATYHWHRDMCLDWTWLRTLFPVLPMYVWNSTT